MRRFTQLYCELDQTTRTSEKVAALERYFRDAAPASAAWALYILTGRKFIRRPVTSKLLREWVCAETNIPEWLFDESYDAVGDMSETMTLLLPDARRRRVGNARAGDGGNGQSKSDSSAAENATGARQDRFAAEAGDEYIRGSSENAEPADPHLTSIEFARSGNATVPELDLVAVAQRAEIPILGTDASSCADLGGTDMPLEQVIEERILPLSKLADDQKRALLVRTWRDFSMRERLVFHKLISGTFRVGVASTLVVRAVATVAGIAPAVMAHRVMGRWQPTADDFSRLIGADGGEHDPARPYPFALAHPLEQAPTTLGGPGEWQAEWKWDGIRAQLIRRDGHLLLWSRGEEMINEQFPEIIRAAEALPSGTVLDGEVMAWENGQALPFSVLQHRIGKKKVELGLWPDVPIAFIVFDIMEFEGRDVRSGPLQERREFLANLIGAHFAVRDGVILLAPILPVRSWPELCEMRQHAREAGAEGVMLKRRLSTYGVGRTRGDWWKWKVDPYTVDAVLIYAQRGSGKRASLYTDYTFGVWEKGELLPVAKAYSGLTDAEIREVDAFVRKHTTDQFGPVRVVKPSLVFELAFGGLQESGRHKAGIALRFPRMARWRRDKRPSEADSLDALRALLRQHDAANRSCASAPAEVQDDTPRRNLVSRD